MCVSLDLEFLPARAWEGFWTALFTTLMALFDVSALMKHVTRFTEEIFSALISTIFIVEALVNVFTPFFEDYTIEGRARSFMGACMCFGTYFLATWCKKQRASRLFTPLIRNIIANYGVTIAIVTFTALAAYGFADVGLATLAIPTTLAPTYNDTILGRRRTCPRRRGARAPRVWRPCPRRSRTLSPGAAPLASASTGGRGTPSSGGAGCGAQMHSTCSRRGRSGSACETGSRCRCHRERTGRARWSSTSPTPASRCPQHGSQPSHPAPPRSLPRRPHQPEQE